MVRNRLLPRTPVVGILALAAVVTVAGCSLASSPHDRGKRHLKSGNYEEAVEAYTEAIEADDNVAVAYANRCIANEALGNFDDAINDCTRSLEIAEEEGEPEGYSTWEVLNNRAIANLDLAHYDDAFDDLDAAIEANPDYADAYANRGRIFIDREQYEEAIEDLDRAVGLDPELSEAFGNRGLAYESLGESENAIADYTAAIELSKDPQALFNRAMLRYTLGYFDDAFDDFQAVVENADNPDDYLVYQAEQMVSFLKNRPKGFDPETGVTETP